MELVCQIHGLASIAASRARMSFLSVSDALFLVMSSELLVCRQRAREEDSRDTSRSTTPLGDGE